MPTLELRPTENDVQEISKNVIYECFKPQTLQEVNEYIDYILNHKILPANYPEDEEEILPSNLKEIHKKSFIDEFKYSNTLNERLKDYLIKDKSNIGPYLQFDSNFECGNLGKVIAVSEEEYDLYLNPDTNTKDRCQWFYFSVTNTQKGKTDRKSVV